MGGRPLTPDQQFAALMRLGVARERATAAAYGVVVEPGPPTIPMVVPLPFPIRLVVPWSGLVSENRRFCAHESRIRMTAEYRTARAKVTEIAERAMTVNDERRFPPLAIPLELTARVWFPDNRVHDAPNFAGATHNALKGVVYEDDRWLYKATWGRAGVDVDAPRAEIAIAPFLASGGQ